MNDDDALNALYGGKQVASEEPARKPSGGDELDALYAAHPPKTATTPYRGPEGGMLGQIAEDIPAEVGKSLSTNIQGAISGLGYTPKPPPEDASEFGQLAHAIKEGLRVPYETGKGLLHAAAAIPEAIQAPLKSIIGHPMAEAERYTGRALGKSLEYWFPDTKAGELGKRIAKTAEEEDPRKAYEQTAEGVGTALSAGRPAGFGPQGRIPGAPRPVPAMKTDEIFETSGNLFDVARQSGVQIKPNALYTKLDDLGSELRGEGFFNMKGSGKAAFNKLQELRESPEMINQFGMTDIGRVHSAIKDLREMERIAKSDRKREALRMVENGLTEWLYNLPKHPADVAWGHANVQRATEDLQRATALWSIGRKADTVEEVVRNAFSGAKATGSGANIENKLRQGINSLLKSRARIRGFQPDEVSMMRRIVHGDDKSGEILRLLGKMAPSGVISGVAGLEIAHLLGAHGITKFVPGVIGIAAKAAADARKVSQADELSAFVRSKATAGATTRLPPYWNWKKRSALDPRVMAPFLNKFNKDEQQQP